jgi:hypothetical protein
VVNSATDRTQKTGGMAAGENKNECVH